MTTAVKRRRRIEPEPKNMYAAASNAPSASPAITEQWINCNAVYFFAGIITRPKSLKLSSIRPLHIRVVIKSENIVLEEKNGSLYR